MIKISTFDEWKDPGKDPTILALLALCVFLGRFNESAAPVWPWSTVYSADRIMNLPAIHSKKKDFPGARDDDTVDGRTVHVVPSLVLQGFLGTYITRHIILSFFLVQPTCQLQVPSSLAKSCSIWPWWHAVFFNFFWSWQLVPIVCVLDAAFDFFFIHQK